MIDNSKLKDHTKKGDTLYTPLNAALGDTMQLSSWGRDHLPEYIWIASIIDGLGRDEGLKRLYQVLRTLNAGNMAVADLSSVFQMSDFQQENFYSVLDHFGLEEFIKPFSVVITSDISSVFFNHYADIGMNVDKEVDYIMELIRKCYSFHDELTTDVCFIVVWSMAISGHLHISANLQGTTDALTEYWKHPHSDEIMRAYRPSIRALCQSAWTFSSSSFPQKFWKQLGEISPCREIYLRWEPVVENSDSFDKIVDRTMEYLEASNEDKKLDVKYSVIMGLTCYIYKLYREIIDNNLENDISGYISFRTMIETYINLKYLMVNEGQKPDIYKMYKAYGIGKYKLPMAKIREGKFSVSSESHVNEKMMELLVNEDMDESFINMSLGFFDKENIRKKFSTCGEDDLYEIYYEYDTNFAHGFWGAVRESSMLACDNPAHAFHQVPDYHALQKLKSVRPDCDMLMKRLFKTLSTQNPYIILPDFCLEQITINVQKQI